LHAALSRGYYGGLEVQKMHVQISKKVDLREGEELQGFIQAVHQAVDMAPAPAGVQSQAPGEPVRLWLRGIFSDFVIARVAMTARYFRAGFKRDKTTGEVKLAAWQEVKQAWVPMSATTKALEGEGADLLKAEMGGEILKQLAEQTEPVAVDPDAGLFAAVIEGRQ
jgi:hypothetical protein